jgi:ribonuclease P protein component
VSKQFLHLKKRFEFVKVSKSGTTVAKPSFVLQFFTHTPAPEDSTPPTLRFGFTASRKVGNAVKRNRAKRRLRALVQKNLPLMQSDMQPAFSRPLDIVLVARTRTVELPFPRLERDFQEALALMGKSKAYLPPSTSPKNPEMPVIPSFPVGERGNPE